jgi:hypothetical protein
MQWGVTLFLAYELLAPREVDELLPRLLRLPWFRNGTMPQWLRRLLVRELPRPRRRLVRERLEHLLLAFLEEPGRGLRPRLPGEAGGQGGAAGWPLAAGLRGWLDAWRRRRRLMLRLEVAPARSPLAEPVFFDFVTHNDLAEALPERLREGLFRRGIAAFGLRLAPALALLSAAVLTALFLLLLAQPVYDIYTPGYVPDLMSRLLFRAPRGTTDPHFSYTPTTARRGETVEVTIQPVTPGAYDLTHMSLAPSDPRSGISLTRIDAGPGLSYNTASANSNALSVPITIAPDAPLGPTELLLNEAGQLRARLPFYVTGPPLSLEYSLTIQMVRNGKPYKEPFESTGRERYESGSVFWMNVTTQGPGYLYLLNEGPGANGKLVYTVLYPTLALRGDARISGGQQVHIGEEDGFIFGKGTGTEKIWLIWSAQPVPEMEAVKGLMNEKDQGEVTDPMQIEAVHAFLSRHETLKTEAAEDKSSKRMTIKSSDEVLVHRAELEHY